MTMLVGDIVYLVVLVTMMLVGNIGNTMVIGAVLSDKRLRSKDTNLFVMNLAIADLCVTGFVDPFSVAGVFVGPSFWATNSGLCHVIGCVCLVSCVCSLWTIAAISFNRFVLLCRNHWYRKIFSKRKMIYIMIFLWVGPFLLDLPNFLDWGDHAYDLKTMACSYDRTKSYSYTVFFISMFVTLPLITVMICNINIYIVVRRSKLRVAAHSQKVWSVDNEVSGYDVNSTFVGDTAVSGISDSTEMVTLDEPRKIDSQTADQVTNERSETKHVTTNQSLNVPTGRKELNADNKKKKACDSFKQEVKLAKTLFVVFTVFCFCWAPYALMCLIDRYDVIPKGAYATGVLLAHSSSTLNSILYAATNKGFRSGYKQFLRKCCCCCHR